MVKLGVKPSQYDPAVFSWHHNNKVQGIVRKHVDDFFFWGTDEFKRKVISPVHEKFVIESEYHTAFKYLGLNVRQLANYYIHVDQIHYGKSVKESPIAEAEIKDFRRLIGQLGWPANQTRPNLAFDLCDLSSRVKNVTVKDLFRANKVLARPNLNL